jgi:hypothetical protein
MKSFLALASASLFACSTAEQTGPNPTPTGVTAAAAAMPRAATCPASIDAVHAFTSKDDARSRIEGTWRICSGTLVADERLFPGDVHGLVIEGGHASLLVDRDGELVRATTWDHDYEVFVFLHDEFEEPDVPKVWQIVLQRPGFSWSFEPRLSEMGDAVHLAENPYLPHPGDLLLAREVAR